MSSKITIIDSDQRPEGHRPRYPIPRLLADKRDPMFDLPGVSGSKVVVEIGSQWGWWAHRAAVQLPGATVYSVDMWSDEPVAVKHYRGGTENMWDWCYNVRQWIGDRVIGLCGTSKDCAQDFLSVSGGKFIDLLFIDGDHTEDGVMSDLFSWHALVVDGGTIVGHDWTGRWGKHVRAGVTRFFDVDERDVDVDPLYWSSRGRDMSKCWYRRTT